VSLTIFLPPSYGYPFAGFEVIYRLEATRSARFYPHTECGDEIAPYGSGAIPI
jgi:aldose 1-epimerase